MTYKLLIDGQLVAGALTLDVINPATGKLLETAPRADKSQLDQAVAAAKRAFPAWAAKSYAERGALLNKLADVLEARQPNFARLLTQEQGKPQQESAIEASIMIETFRHFAEQELEPKVLHETEAEQIVEHRTPLGVVAAIAPWNFPLALISHKIAAALITGNTVIAKPAPSTPLGTLLIGELAAPLFPAGVFQIIVDNNDLGAVLTSHPDVAAVNFTGSTGTGKKVMSSAVDTLKRVTLELGGNDAAILLEDVDVESVAPKIYQSAMTNAGQVCIATKRVYAHESIYEELCDALGKLAREAVVGDGLEQGTQVGPIQNRQQYEKVLSYIEQARKDGKVVAGGEPVEGEGFFIRPTIVRDLPADSPLIHEEQFGPVLPVISFSDVEEAITQVNSSPYGLGGSVWGADRERATAVAERIDSGTVWVNRHMHLPMHVPFGGAKQSGIGRQHGLDSLHEVTQLKIVNIDLQAA